jgi:hypothetical protein
MPANSNNSAAIASIFMPSSIKTLGDNRQRYLTTGQVWP